jgi:hypothetical protein
VVRPGAERAAQDPHHLLPRHLLRTRPHHRHQHHPGAWKRGPHVRTHSGGVYTQAWGVRVGGGTMLCSSTSSPTSTSPVRVAANPTCAQRGVQVVHTRKPGACECGGHTELGAADWGRHVRRDRLLTRGVTATACRRSWSFRAWTTTRRWVQPICFACKDKGVWPHADTDEDRGSGFGGGTLARVCVRESLWPGSAKAAQRILNPYYPRVRWLRRGRSGCTRASSGPTSP